MNMRRRIIASAWLSILAAGCATGEGARDSQRPSGERQYDSMSAPTPDDVALKITGADAGQNVTVKIGTTIAVELVGIPTAGYLWTPVEIPAFLEAAGEYGGPTSSAQLEPGFTGGRHWEAFLFKVAEAGEGEFRFEQRRPWEDASEPPADAFSVFLFAEE